ncbi:MAG: GNAT family N-acetyltransferase [Flavobacteriales bacterium]|nr:GNAT family N-acetyltransferase [Flavobacteriales bacterium]
MQVLDFSVFPDLRTDRLRLREMRADDTDRLFALRSDPRVMRHIGRPIAQERADARELIDRNAAIRASNEGLTWAITLADDDTLIGTIGFYRLKPEHWTGEVGYLLDPAHWGKGLMREALEHITEHGFTAIGFHRIEAITAPDNTASRALLERCGYRLDGIMRGNYHWEGRQLDSAVYGRLIGD